MRQGCRYVGFYVDNYDTILPSDESLGNIASTLWYQFIKGQFDEYIWSNFYKRELFDNPKFCDEDELKVLNNIKKTLLIHFKSKARLYERLFEGYMADFNPLWNVDGVVGEIRETNHTGTDTDAHTGTDSNSSTDGGSLIRTGNETDAYAGKQSNTRTGDQTTTYEGADVQVTSKTTFDSATFKEVEKVETGFTQGDGHDRQDNVHYTNLKDETEFTNRLDTHTYNNVTDTRNLTSNGTTTYNSTLQRTKALKDTDLFMQIRQGNIGVVSSVKLLEEFFAMYGENKLIDFVHYVVNDCVSQISYSIY